MSLVTRCPACGTSFKVVRDQLRISDGWVRCGRCSEVFDASADLRDTPDGSAPSGLPEPPAASAPAIARADANGDADAGAGSGTDVKAGAEGDTDAEVEAEFESGPETDAEIPTGFDRLEGFDEVDDFDAAEALDATRRAGEPVGALPSSIDPSFQQPEPEAQPHSIAEADARQNTNAISEPGENSLPSPKLESSTEPESTPTPPTEVGPVRAADGNFVAALRFPDHPQPPSETLRYWPASDLLDLGASIQLLAPSSPATPPPSSRTTGFPALPDIPPYGLVADEPWPTPAPLSVGGRASAPTLTEAAEPSSNAPLPTAPFINVQFDKALRRARDKAAKIARSRERRDDALPAVVPIGLSSADPTAAVPAAATATVTSTATAADPTSVSEPAALDTAPGTSPVVLGTVPSFLEADIPRRVRSHRVERPRAWIAAAAVAALILAVQVVRQERDTMVARQPEIRPALSLLCKLTGCEISAVRQIGAINIDGAAFTREKGVDGYRLTFTLRNSVAMPLAMPAVELTLLDTQERAVVRRVIMPGDFNAPPVLPANAERAASLALTLNVAEAAALPPIAGYRVVAFYP